MVPKNSSTVGRKLANEQKPWGPRMASVDILTVTTPDTFLWYNQVM